MNPDILIAHPYLAAGLAALIANGFVAGVLYGVSGAARQHGRALQAWGRRTFTAAGDQPSCGCDRFHTEIFCVACRRVRVLTPTSTLTPADAHVLLDSFDEVQRRRAAFEKWEDCDETAVM